MKRLLNKPTIYILLIITLLMAAVPGIAAQESSAITFASESRLARGRWVKIAVRQTGLHRITAEQIRQMGFTSVDNVKVYGYGGQRLNDVLSAQYIIDDLPQTPSVVDGGGIVFYAYGPVTWSETANGSGKFLHSMNPYTFEGYYYLSDTAEERLAPSPSTYPAPTTLMGASTSFREHLMHHNEQAALGTSGFTFLGEDLLGGKSVTTHFSLPGIVDNNVDNKVWACIGVGGYLSVKSNYNITFVPEMSNPQPSISLSRPGSHSYIKGVTATGNFSATTFAGDKLSVTVTGPDDAGAKMSNLHFIDVTYERKLDMAGLDVLQFRLRTSKGALTNASGVVVWDVTSPTDMPLLNTATVEGALVFQNMASGIREYVAWRPGTALPSPAVVGTVGNQNLHGIGNPHYVIFTHPSLKVEAERLARYRRGAPSNLDVVVVSVDDVYEEFGSGAPDPQAMRRMLKMLYNRPESNLRYALFMGRPLWDYRRVTPRSRMGECNGALLPAWETINSTNEFTESRISYDHYAYLDDNTRADANNAKMRIAIGLIPANTLALARTAVDKIIAHETQTPSGSWRGNVMTITDVADEAATDFMPQADRMYNAYLSSSPGATLNGVGCGLSPEKLYLDAYRYSNGRMPEAENRLRKALNDGLSWLVYIGHSSHTSWSSIDLLPYNYVQTMTLRRRPVLLSASCDYAVIDGPELCGGEALFRNPGGAAAVIATTRSAAVLYNGDVVRYIGESVPLYTNAEYRGDEGSLLTVGQVLQRAKNRIISETSRKNATLFVLLGDPAMPQTIPSRYVALKSITDLASGDMLDLDGDTPPNIRGGSRVRFEGNIVDHKGETVTNFDGDVELTLYDALYDTPTQGHNDDPYILTQQGGRLTMARGRVAAGVWTAEMIVPMEIANNNTPAELSCYARTIDNTGDARGADRRFTISGIAGELVDAEPPTIRSMYLNQPGFKNGDTTDPSPMFYALLSDDMGINISSSGVGRDMTLTLDGTRVYSGLASRFIPDFGGTESGSVSYPLSGLEDGPHTLEFEVWDMADKATRGALSFYVDATIEPSILNVYTDANPATTAASFYIVHDRPDKDVLVGIEIFDLMGRRIWERRERSYSEGNTARPIVWDLTTGAGSRVSNGIYIYRATLSLPNGEKHASKSHKLAVSIR